MTTKKAQLIDLRFLRDRAALTRILLVTLGCAAAGLLYGRLGQKWYTSAVTFVPVRTQRPASVSSLLGGDLGSLAAGFDAGLGGGADAARITAVLQSVAVTDAVIERFQLRGRYRQKYQESAREALWRHCGVRTLPRPNLVQLWCEDTDPLFVKEMLSFFSDYGNQVFRRVGVSSATEEVRFLEKRVAELRQQADEAATRMRTFQEKHQIVDLDAQARAVVSSVAALNSQRITKQMELDYAHTYSARDEATTRQLESQLGVVNEKLRDLEDVGPPAAGALSGGTPPVSGKTGMFPPALTVPRLRAEFENLYRDRKVAEATLVYALERLEGAKANEARDVSTFQVLDPATLPTRKSRPKTIETTFVAAALGLAAGVLLAWWMARGAHRGKPSPPEPATDLERAR